jgi:hypothetical protein
MSCAKRFISAVLLNVASSLVALAAPSPVTLVHTVEIAAMPDRATITVSQGQNVIAVVPGAIVVQEGSQVVTVVGRATLPIEGGPYTILFTVYAKTGELGSSTRQIPDVRLEPAVLLDVSELKRRLGEQKAELRKWDDKSNEQKVRLKKIQAQADTAQSVGRIIDADDELRMAKEENARLTASLNLAQERQIALKTRESPPNFKKREAELSSYLNLLSTELKTAEEDGAFESGSKELQQKQDLIEATKYEHVDLLKEELVRLRRQREQLERGSPRAP